MPIVQDRVTHKLPADACSQVVTAVRHGPAALSADRGARDCAADVHCLDILRARRIAAALRGARARRA